MLDKTLYDKTINYISTLRTSPTVNESEYRQILAMLCDVVLHEEDVEKIHTTIENFEKSNQKCSSCGIPLDTWEKDICGPCKINDVRFSDDSLDE